MNKIIVKNPVVELNGDEMPFYILKETYIPGYEYEFLFNKSEYF